MPTPNPPDGPRAPSRRDFLRGAAVGAVATGLLEPREAAAADHAGPSVSGTVTAPLKVNGRVIEVDVEPRTTLLDALRDGHTAGGEAVDQTGAKKVCDRGTCGACTVLLDGKPIYACSMLALDAVDHEIETVEGFAAGDELHAVQAAFVEHDALMCGFCTPGFVTSAVALLRDNKAPSRAEIQAALNGNFCRCGTYHRIFEAVADAAGRLA